MDSVPPVTGLPLKSMLASNVDAATGIFIPIFPLPFGVSIKSSLAAVVISVAAPLKVRPVEPIVLLVNI